MKPQLRFGISYNGQHGDKQKACSSYAILIFSGNVTGDYLARKEGMDEWAAISELAEFEDALGTSASNPDFLDQEVLRMSARRLRLPKEDVEPDQPGPSGPPPIPPRSPKSSAGSQVAASLSALKANAAAAGQLVTKQAQRTKIAR